LLLIFSLPYLLFPLPTGSRDDEEKEKKRLRKQLIERERELDALKQALEALLRELKEENGQDRDAARRAGGGRDDGDDGGVARPAVGAEGGLL
jgi:8-oxo-dGTP pyrophosphatase MutT (NUDIX family)